MTFCLKQKKQLLYEDYLEIESWDGYDIYHTTAWHQFLKQVFSWNVNFFCIYQDRELVFILPYVNKFRQNLKRYKISLPFSHHVIPLVKPEFAESLEFFYEMIAVPTRRLEIHSKINSSKLSFDAKNYITQIDFGHIENQQDLFKKLDYKSVRYMINRAEKNHIVIDKTPSLKNMDFFYELECETRRRQGAPIYPHNFFRQLYECCHAHLSIIIAFFENKPVSGAIFFHNKNNTVYGYAASVSDKNIKKLGINEIVLWEALKSSYLKGDEFFDFGTTPVHHTGLRKYKEKWGAESILQEYSYSATQPNHIDSQIARDGKIAKLASWIFSNLPSAVYKKITPYFLKLAI